MKYVPVIALGLALVFASSAWTYQREGGRGQNLGQNRGQLRDRVGGGNRSTSYYAAPYYGGGYYGGYYGGDPYANYGASTVAEGNMRGMSDMIRSAGVNSLLNSQAAINYEQARSADYDNRLKYEQTYFEMKQMNDSYRASQRRPPMSSEYFAKLAAKQAPDRLSSAALDPVTGAIAWPRLLQIDTFAPYREKLDALFAQRTASHGHIGEETYSEIRQTTDRMLATLKKNIRSYPPEDYLTAKNFIESLSYEARFPVS